MEVYSGLPIIFSSVSTWYWLLLQIQRLNFNEMFSKSKVHNDTYFKSRDSISVKWLVNLKYTMTPTVIIIFQMILLFPIAKHGMCPIFERMSSFYIINSSWLPEYFNKNFIETSDDEFSLTLSIVVAYRRLTYPQVW